MNEQILGLSLECAARAEEYADVEYAKRQTGYCRQDFFNYKLVELIVRECAQFVEDKFDFCGDEIIIAEEVRKHFGVEE